MIAQKTLNAAANTGYTVVLDGTNSIPAGFSSVTIRSTGSVYVKTFAFTNSFVAQAVPTAAVIPGAGQTSDYYHMAANEVVKFGLELPYGGDKTGATAYGDRIQQITVWSTANCEVVINCH